MEEPKPPENRNINTGGGNYNERIEGDYIQGSVFRIQNIVVHVYNYKYGEGNNNFNSDNLQCPYRGLFHFNPDDAEYFFGRGSLIKELLRATESRNFIPVLGASGSGKSSVIFAGLLPKLAQRNHWKFTHFRPSSDPFYALAEALVPLYQDKTINAYELAEKLKNKQFLKNEISCIKSKYDNYKLLLIVDQFEELYTLCDDDKTRRKFLDCLLTIIEPPASKSPSAVVLVVSMRADFLSHTLLYADFAEQLKNDIKLSAMKRSELSEVIAKPAEKLGIKFESKLIERILDDIEDEPGNLPLLEFALTLLWEKRTNQQLTHVAYAEIGEVQGALASYADRVYRNLDKNQKQQVSRVFMQLVRLGEGTEDTRRMATKVELGEENWSLVQHLADKRLVVTSHSADGQETVEVAHEALIQHWQLLQSWIDENRSKILQKNKIERLALEWRDNKESNDYLLQGKQLNEAKAFQKQKSENFALSKLACKCIQQSLRYRRNNRFRLIAFGLLPFISLAIYLGIIAEREIKIRGAWNTIDAVQEKKESSGRIKALEELTNARVSLHKILLKDTNLAGADLSDGKFTSADFSGADLSSTGLVRADFSDANLSKSNLKHAVAKYANFRGANLSNTNLSNAYLSPNVDFLNANLQKANLVDANLASSSIVGANLSGANLSNANLSGANLSGANLGGSLIRSTHFSGANLSNADLAYADLENANFYNADLTKVNFSTARFYPTTKITLQQLKTTKNWDKACYSLEFRKQLGLPPKNPSECPIPAPSSIHSQFEQDENLTPNDEILYESLLYPKLEVSFFR